MRDFPSCFGENGVRVVNSSSSSPSGRQTAQNFVSCVYQSNIRGRSCLITVTWSKNLVGQGLSVSIDDATSQSICKVDLKPWLFSKKKGSKSLDGRTRLDIFWDFSTARFGSGPEPLDGYYLVVVLEGETVLLLGDLPKGAFRKANTSELNSNPKFIAKRENVFGQGVYSTKAQFCDNGSIHDVAIECNTDDGTDLYLLIRVDKRTVMQVKRLTWKFRGNQTILVDGLPVEVFWDVHNWLFSQTAGSAVFMFHTSRSVDKLWSSQHFSDSSLKLSWSTVGERQSQQANLAFSLILYAWKNE